MTEKEKKELEPQVSQSVTSKEGQSEAKTTTAGKAKAVPKKKKAAKTTGKAGSATKSKSRTSKKDKPKTAAEYLAEFEALAKKNHGVLTYKEIQDRMQNVDDVSVDLWMPSIPNWLKRTLKWSMTVPKTKNRIQSMKMN